MEGVESSEQLQSEFAGLPSLMMTPLVQSLIPQMHRRVEQESELWHHWRLAIAENFFFACKTVLNTIPPERDKMTWRSHGLLCRLVEDDSIKQLLVEYPRKMLKSSIVTSRRPIHMLLKRLALGLDPWQRNFILSHTAKVAQRHWWEIKTILDGDSEGSRLLRFFFPDLEHDREDRWNDTLGYIKRNYDPRDPTFEAIAKKSAGKHCDELHADDLIDEENYDSPDAVANAITLFRYTNNWLEGEESRLFVTGNRWGLLDLNSTIHRESELTDFVILSVSAEEGPNTGGEFSCFNLPEYAQEMCEEMARVANRFGTAWPERFTPGYLAKLRAKLGPAIYSAQYLNRPEDPSATEFDTSLVKRGRMITIQRDPYLKLPDIEDPVPLSSCNVYVSWDPALDEKKSRSENAIVAAAYTWNGLLVVIKEHAHKEDPLRSLNKFIAFCRLFKGYLKASGIEEVLFQKVLKKLLRQMGQMTRTFLGLRKIKTPTSKSKDQRIRAWLGTFIESGRLYVLDTCPKTYQQIRLFGVEGAPRDLIDALSNLTQLLDKPRSYADELESEEFEASIIAEAGITGYGETLGGRYSIH